MSPRVMLAAAVAIPRAVSVHSGALTPSPLQSYHNASLFTSRVPSPTPPPPPRRPPSLLGVDDDYDDHITTTTPTYSST